ncbi:Uncharacterized protein containing a divergent version of the methyl-accepting chemotaxis-like domain [Slackia heliotrinireducens]|uniref:Uncharacterized protein containing a divergent version of the methyl-accepting chemotaxis-like domain n=1 Tax=Slackia heliotrinireducens (strain ATCC 29202 / DSM 20476 / NCTC 11029 / RHS 1) TaxID=471855 RepID=C7N4J9_SLAHD|nr:hypothetical protein [Slackia heliotrinireducens]ACV21834.1 uncharacterized protein containing a divergent version of the methyl-accepting chemotaxis-like domain [Slackia heliotrinireducens DSM 20476]VEG99564.1 Uncharacterized protein containing a divergent version of the methyl-accepting chemotaxis-like domain [Slackia heliotrinireducens]
MPVISEIIIPIVYVVVGIALIAALVELFLVLRTTRKTVDDLNAQVQPVLADVKTITESAKPAVDRVDPLVERVALTVDAANLEIMRLDGILENVGTITETASNATQAVDAITSTPLRAVSDATARVRDILGSKKASDESKQLAENAESFAELEDGEIVSLESLAVTGSENQAPSGEPEQAAAPADKPDPIAEKYFTYGKPAAEE